MFQLEEVLSAHSHKNDLAEYLELMCIINDNDTLSVEDAANAIYPEDDDDISANENMRLRFGEALAIVDERSNFLEGRYPFKGHTDFIEYNNNKDSMFCELYKFMVLATNENMGINRKSNGIDGTELFESLSSIVLKNYFGENCNPFVFGTSDKGHSKFEDKINNLLKQINEPGMSFRHPDGDNNMEKDGGVDVVANIPFGDERKGQFIALGQCKTGASWDQNNRSVKLNNFCALYLGPTICLQPVNAYFLSQEICDNWESSAKDCLLFDRKRIMNKLPKSIDSELISKICKWNKGIVEKHS
jgi:hypothetical protein